MYIHMDIYTCTYMYIFVYISYCSVDEYIHTKSYTHILYGVATLSRLLKTIGLFCRISSLL